MSNPFRIVGDDIEYEFVPVARFLPGAILGYRSQAEDALWSVEDAEMISVAEAEKEREADIEAIETEHAAEIARFEVKLEQKEAEADFADEEARQAKEDLEAHLGGELMEALAAYRAEIAELRGSADRQGDCGDGLPGARRGLITQLAQQNRDIEALQIDPGGARQSAEEAAQAYLTNLTNMLCDGGDPSFGGPMPETPAVDMDKLERELRDEHDYGGDAPHRVGMDAHKYIPARPPAPKPVDALAQILEARGKVHGDFADHASIAQTLKAVMRETRNWPHLSAFQRESLEMNAHKIGRILAGDPNYPDHWDDIAGYAKLVSQRL